MSTEGQSYTLLIVLGHGYDVCDEDNIFLKMLNQSGFLLSLP
jgi:hypothetical protein